MRGVVTDYEYVIPFYVDFLENPKRKIASKFNLNWIMLSIHENNFTRVCLVVISQSYITNRLQDAPRNTDISKNDDTQSTM